MIIPELPEYLSNLGGEAYKGLIISLFTLTAGLSRPFSGKLTDTVGRIPVLIIGTVVCIVCSLIYPFISGVAGFLLLRFFHGFSTGFKPTATVAYVADIIPSSRRGEGLGINGISSNIGFSLAPALGSWIAIQYGLDIMFYCSSGLALASLLIVLGMKETLTDGEPFRWQLLRLKKNDLFERSALAPSVLIGLVYISYGYILTIVPDQCVHLGMSNKGLYFTSFTLFSILSRIVAGKISDRKGRLPVTRVACIMTALALVSMGLANSPFWLLVSAGFLGFATGTAIPTIMAWTVDRAPGALRGKAIATSYIALEIGIGGGALLSAWLYANNPDNFLMAFCIAALLNFFTIPFLYWWMKRNPSIKLPPSPESN